MTRSHLLASIVHLVTSRQLSFESRRMKKHLKDNEKRNDLTLILTAYCFDSLHKRCVNFIRQEKENNMRQKN